MQMEGLGIWKANVKIKNLINSMFWMHFTVIFSQVKEVPLSVNYLWALAFRVKSLFFFKAEHLQILTDKASINWGKWPASCFYLMKPFVGHIT